MSAKRGCQPGGTAVNSITAPVLVVVNGEERSVRSGATIADLIRALDLDPERLAIELDRRIVKRAEWPATTLTAGASLEIVQFVGGG
jgi:thiamine biosynthesis protein ThiS